VQYIARHAGHFTIRTPQAIIHARQVVSTLPLQNLRQLAPTLAHERLTPYLQRDTQSYGGAIVVCLGVPEDETDTQSFTHHQLLQSYEQPLGNGNNMFISVSAPGDTLSAPAGFRAVMISTHCELSEWEALSVDEYRRQKQQITQRLIALAQRVYPHLGNHAKVIETGTPRTYERFTQRPRGNVGGVRQSVRNSNQQSLPHDLLGNGFWLAGDATWPGLGTVACVLGSRLVSDAIIAQTRSYRVNARSWYLNAINRHTRLGMSGKEI
jgi:phytoene dehydrogenase-like protein